jgi:hypothetical protein
MGGTPMKHNVIDGIEVPYALDTIEMIDPDIVGRATLFTRRGDSIFISELEGKLRESLIADYRRRSPDSYPELIMYSGSTTEALSPAQ